jgi:hypothetical protein
VDNICFVSEKRYYYGYIYEKDVLIEVISSVVASVAYTVDIENPDVVALLRLQGKLYGMKPEEINYEKELAFIKDKKAILESISN